MYRTMCRNIHAISPFRKNGGGYALIAVFEGSGTVMETVPVNGEAVIPWETMAQPGYLRIGLYGVKNEQIKAAVWTTMLTVEEGTDTTGQDPEQSSSWQAAVQQMAEYLEGAREAVSHYPIIGANGNWFVWNAELEEYEDTGHQSSGGGSGSGAVDSVNGKTGAVVLDAEDVGAMPDSATLADITGDSTHRTVTDAEKTEWDAKADEEDITDLQQQIDAIVGQSDVRDVVGNYTELTAYDTSMLGNNDIVKVLEDSTHSNGRSYYRWVITGGVGAWDYVGTEGIGYTKAEADTLLNQKQGTISDLGTIRSGAQAGATAYQKPGTGIPKIDLASAVQTSIERADTALQSHQDISGKLDAENVSHESWEFTLDDDTTVTKEVVVWTGAV